MKYEFTVIFKDEFGEQNGEVYTQVIEWDTDEIGCEDFPKVAYMLAESTALEFLETVEGEEDTVRGMAQLVEVLGVIEGRVNVETYMPDPAPFIRLATHNGNRLSNLIQCESREGGFVDAALLKTV